MSSYAVANGLEIGIYDNITFRATQKWLVIPLKHQCMKVQQEEERQKDEEHQEEDTEQNVEILYL